MTEVMENKKINLNKVFRDEIMAISSQFKQGETIVYPTDTIYGLGCDATHQKAVDKVFKIKKRKKKQPLLVLVSSISLLKKYAYVSRKQEEYLKKCWPGPVTVILKDRGILAKNVASLEGGLAVRLPKSKFLIKIIREVGKPIVSTSINISGKNSILDPDNIEKKLGKVKPDIIIDAGKTKNKKPSKVVDLRDINNIYILRN